MKSCRNCKQSKHCTIMGKVLVSHNSSSSTKYNQERDSTLQKVAEICPCFEAEKE